MAGLGSVGLGGFVLLALLSWATGTNFLSLLSGGGDPTSTAVGNAPPASTTPAEEREVDFVDAVMKDVQGTWETLLRRRYQATRAVIFRDAINPRADGRVGDRAFLLSRRRGACTSTSDFSTSSASGSARPAISPGVRDPHEVGHHIQHLIGIEARCGTVQRASARSNGRCALELQADCFAGVWGHAASQPAAPRKDRWSSSPATSKGASRGRRDRRRPSAEDGTGRVMPERSRTARPRKESNGSTGG